MRIDEIYKGSRASGVNTPSEIMPDGAGLIIMCNNMITYDLSIPPILEPKTSSAG